jgi:hypothetical protein
MMRQGRRTCLLKIGVAVLGFLPNTLTFAKSSSCSAMAVSRCYVVTLADRS